MRTISIDNSSDISSSSRLKRGLRFCLSVWICHIFVKNLWTFRYIWCFTHICKCRREWEGLNGILWCLYTSTSHHRFARNVEPSNVLLVSWVDFWHRNKEHYVCYYTIGHWRTTHRTIILGVKFNYGIFIVFNPINLLHNRNKFTKEKFVYSTYIYSTYKSM